MSSGPFSAWLVMHRWPGEDWHFSEPFGTRIEAEAAAHLLRVELGEEPQIDVVAGIA